MMSFRIVSLFLVLSFVALSYCIKDGAAVDGCDYPGLVTIVNPGNNVVSCTGVVSGGNLLLSEMCGLGFEFVSNFVELNLYYGDGTSFITIPQSTTGTKTDGVYTIPLPTTITDSCDVDATLYDSSTMSLDLASCQMVGYGADTDAAATYDSEPDATSVTYSTSEPCCGTILVSVDSTNVPDTTVPLNCLKATGSACGSGDLGSPIYCNETTTNELVVIGLTATAPCNSGELYLVHDLTNSDTEFKF